MKDRWSLLPIFFLVITYSAHAQNAEKTLGGTSWQLIKFQNGNGAVLMPSDKAKYTVVFDSGNGVSVRIDCNRGHGTWKSSQSNQLQFGPLALTRTMCPPAALNDRLAKDWIQVQSYVIKDDHLFLSLKAASSTYEFEPTAVSDSNKPEPQVSSRGPLKYGCTQDEDRDPEIIKVTYYNTRPGLLLIERQNQTRPAFQVRSASGAKYAGEDFTFWAAHGEATMNWSGAEFKCKLR